MTVITYVKSEMLRTSYNMANSMGLGATSRVFLDIAQTGVSTVGNGFQYVKLCKGNPFNPRAASALPLPNFTNSSICIDSTQTHVSFMPLAA